MAASLRTKTFAHRGSTLLEVAFVVVIVGLAITALMEFLANATSTNRNMSNTPIALALCRAGHEWAGTRTHSELMALFDASGSYKPTDLLNASGIGDGSTGADLPQGTDAVRTYVGWAQQFNMRKVKANALTESAPATDLTAPLEITISAVRNGTPIASLTRVYFIH